MTNFSTSTEEEEEVEDFSVKTAGNIPSVGSPEAGSSMVVKALRYKTEGRGFSTR
jgi:hypothetical protein